MNEGATMTASYNNLPIEAAFTLVDALNPGFGYQIRITRGPQTLLWTSRNPATGKDLLTAADCLEVLAMYTGASR